MREWMPLDALNWFGRGNELHTPKPRFAFLAWGDYTCSRFARSTIPEEIWGPLVVFVSCPLQKQIDERVLIPFVRCQVAPKCLRMSLIIDISIFFIFFFLESRISQLMSQYWKLLSGVSAIYHSNFILRLLGNVILKQNWVGMKAS